MVQSIRLFDFWARIFPPFLRVQMHDYDASFCKDQV
jgi:hypothetical protein